MLKIRLARFGRTKLPFYRIVAIPDREKRSGKPVSYLGTYDPISKEVKLDEEKVLFYLKNGAQPTKTTEVILKKRGIMEKFMESKKKIQ